MRKLAVLLTMLFASAFLCMAQTDSDHSKHAAGKKGGGAATLTGCLSGPNQEGVYELKSGKKTVEVGGLDDLSKHVGHQVKLHGNWANSTEIGEKESGAEHKDADADKAKGKTDEKSERHFKVSSIDHVSDSCTAGAAGTEGHGKKGSGSTTPK
jgi:hypothetical protein